MFETEIERIREKLGRARLHLNAPLPEGAISAFEIAQGVQLPEGYRDFLLRLGNGGAGPYHGLLPLEQWTDAFACSSPDAHGFLAAPSHLVPDTPGAIADVPEDRFHQGTLTIAVDGCGFFTLLVVSGPARGQVVGTDGGYTKPFFYRSTGFLHWYETWLDDQLGLRASSGPWFHFRT